jgi:hypothetical protein
MALGQAVDGRAVEEEAAVPVERLLVGLRPIGAAVLDHRGQEALLHRRRGGEQHAHRRHQPGGEDEARPRAPQVRRELRGLEAVEALLDHHGLPRMLEREG